MNCWSKMIKLKNLNGKSRYGSQEILVIEEIKVSPLGQDTQTKLMYSQ